MRTLIVYESIYGATHAAAERIAEGLRETGEVVVVPVAEATAEQVAAADLLVVGGPTHMHGLSTSRSRKMGVKAAADDKHGDVVLDPDAEGPGIRDWLGGLVVAEGRRAAAFDTRLEGKPALTGRASRGIARRLHHHGFDVVADPESFLVDMQNHLMPGEEDRASSWGAALAAALMEVGR